jgi:aspartyl-tRNA(Asn)/glutamyl-tRNA(Gln) amidotransferase subunit B
MSDQETIEEIVEALVLANPDRAEQAKLKVALIGWFVGQGMRRSRGAADPKLLADAFVERLGLWSDDARHPPSLDPL